jgi:glycosyltransferase involved in cell wall biosynthesis
MTVVGRQPTAAVRRLAHLPGVEVIGQVPDVRPYYAQAAVVVAPLRLARGVQNKLLEALAMGKALVASSATLAGLKAQPGVHLLRADSPIEWETAISQLLEDRSLREQLGAAGRQYVEDNHRWDQCLEPLRQLLLMRDSI